MRHVLIGLFGALLLGSCAAQPQVRVPVHPAAPAGSVNIYRDDWGVPHIYAAREDDAMFGVGYALAEDDLHGILKSFLAVRGELAAAFGDAYLESDFFVQQWGFLENARAAYSALPEDEQRRYRAYIAGINRYMADHPQDVPTWKPALEPALSIAVGDMIALSMSLTLDRQGNDDCRAAGIELREVQTAETLPPADGGPTASNQWALMPSRSHDGAAMLWADSHSPFRTLREEVRIHAGSLQTSGIVPAGLMLPILGHTDGVAWSFTNGGPDVADCYEVVVDPQDPTRYLYDGQSRPFERRTFTVRTRSGEQVRTVDYLTDNLVRAPVVGRRNGRAYAIASAYMGQSGVFGSELYAMNRARDMAQFRAALSPLGLIPINVMAASRDGSIYYVANGRSPIRPEGYNWRGPVSGGTSATRWRGFHAFEDLPQLLDPPQGYLINTNVPPDAVVENSPLTTERYRSYLFNDDPGRTNERLLRARELLAGASDVTIDRFLEIGMDEKLILTPVWQRALAGALARSADSTPGDSGAQQVAEAIARFDGVASKESSDALAYFLWRLSINELAQHAGREPAELAATVEQGGASPPSDQAILVQALSQTAARMMRDYGRLDAAYGEAVRIGRGTVSLPLGGATVRSGRRSERTLRSMGCGDFVAGRCFAGGGQRHPILTVFTNPIRSFSGVPFGQSMHPGSPHFSDQSLLASERRLKPVYFDWRQLRAHVESVTHLETGSP